MSDHALKQLKGKPVTHAVEELVTLFPEVSQITFAAYRPAPGLDARLARSADPTLDIRDMAERLRHDFGIPFWDCPDPLQLYQLI